MYCTYRLYDILLIDCSAQRMCVFQVYFHTVQLVSVNFESLQPFFIYTLNKLVAYPLAYHILLPQPIIMPYATSDHSEWANENTGRFMVYSPKLWLWLLFCKELSLLNTE